MEKYVLTVERVINAPPEAVFDVLADVSKHAAIDGSGMLQGAHPERPQRLAPGASFGMHMKLFMRYSTENRVVEFDEGKRIAWQTGPTGSAGRFIAGRVWRYELEPTDGDTLVRESWDIRSDHQRVLLKLGRIWWNKTRRDMERTLDRLAALVTAEQANSKDANSNDAHSNNASSKDAG
jgi:uncharacterized protein YndB with AHSA1/START domain